MLNLKAILTNGRLLTKKNKRRAYDAKIRPCVFYCLIFGLRPLAELLHVEFRIDCVEVFGVKVILNDSQTFTEALIVHDFSLTQEADWVEDIRVVAKTDDVVVGRAGFLLWCDLVRTT